MPRKKTQDQYDAQIAKLKKKIADAEGKLKEDKTKLRQLELEKENALAKEIIAYMKEHKNADGLTYFESFTKATQKEKK